MSLIYLIIIILVGISSFGLGRLSVKEDIIDSNDEIQILNSTRSIEAIEDSYFSDNTTQEHISKSTSIEKGEVVRNYVASKNGKKYYTANCGGAKRIKPENRVWFNTEMDAQKLGYELSVTCKK